MKYYPRSIDFRARVEANKKTSSIRIRSKSAISPFFFNINRLHIIIRSSCDYLLLVLK